MTPREKAIQALRRIIIASDYKCSDEDMDVVHDYIALTEPTDEEKKAAYTRPQPDTVAISREVVEQEILPRLKYTIKSACYCRSQDEGYDEDTFCKLCRTISILEAALKAKG